MAVGLKLTPECASGADDTLVARAVQPTPRRTPTRNACRRRDIEQGAQHERALVHARVRYGQARRRQPTPAEQQQIEVQYARRIAPLAALRPPVAMLDGV